MTHEQVVPQEMNKEKSGLSNLQLIILCELALGNGRRAIGEKYAAEYGLTADKCKHMIDRGKESLWAKLDVKNARAAVLKGLMLGLIPLYLFKENCTHYPLLFEAEKKVLDTYIDYPALEQREIAEKLQLSRKTVDVHMNHINRKLQTQNSVHAAVVGLLSRECPVKIQKNIPLASKESEDSFEVIFSDEQGKVVRLMGEKNTVLLTIRRKNLPLSDAVMQMLDTGKYVEVLGGVKIFVFDKDKRATLSA